MTEMTPDLYKAILAMDAYNRGYGAAIKFGTAFDNSDSALNGVTQVGNAIVYRSLGNDAAKAEGFYGIAYQFKDSSGDVTETVISYRGTDSLGGSTENGGSDFNNGYSIAVGDPFFSSQGLLAIAFYQQVASLVYGEDVDPHSSTLDISFTGHSLGGGLAGYVGDLYVQKSIIFDNMTFEDAAEEVYESSLSGYHSDYTSSVYGSLSPWQNSIENLRGYYTDGEFLGVIRGAQETPMTALDIGSDVNLGSGYDGLDAHSMATLIMLLYADVTAGGVTDWKSAAQYFWPVMYDNDFAGSIGFNNGETLAGGDHTKGEYASIMRQTLAYSAIDEGTLVFGNTGIRAFYDDANDFGAALKIAADYNLDTSYLLDFLGSKISQVFVQYAGQLALNKIELDNVGETVLDGVLSTDQWGVLTLDLRDSTWSVAGGGTVPEIVGANGIVSTVFSLIATNHQFLGDVNPTSFENLMTTYWGSSSAEIFEHITFYSFDQNVFLVGKAEAAQSGMANLVIGGGGDNLFETTSGNDFIYGYQGYDTVDYNSSAGTGITVIWNADGTLAVKDPSGSVDILEDVEKIIGKAGYNNILELHGDGELHETSEGVFDFNGHQLTLVNITRIQGDDGDQVFTVQNIPVGGVDGGGGTDTLNYSVDGGILNQITGEKYSDKRMLPINYNDIDNVRITGTPSTVVINPSASGHVTSAGYNDYSAADAKADFSFISNNWFYSSSFWDYFSYDQTFRVNINTGLAQQTGTGYTNSGSGIFSFLYGSMVHYSPVGSAYYRGTDHGDTVTIKSVLTVPTVINFVSGYGDDTINISGDTGFSGGSVSITYTQGNDVIHGTSGLTQINMWADIRPSDVSIAGNLITIAGHGSITLDGMSASDISIKFLGTEKSASIDGSWSDDTWTGKDGRDETFYGLGGDDTLNGNGGQDKLYGGDGNDTLYSLKGANILEGGDGNDAYYVSKSALTTISDQSGVNTLYATDFNKSDMRFAMNSEGKLVVEDMVGNAVLTIDASSSLSHIEFQNGDVVTMADLLTEAFGKLATYDTGEGQDSAYGPSMAGTNAFVDLKGGDDAFYGSTYANVSNTVYGGDGREFIYSGVGNDFIYAGNGDDYALNGGEGNDYIDGGDGTDTYVLGNYTGSGVHGGYVDLGAGIAYDDGTGGVDTLVSIENMQGTRYDDTLVGDDGDNTIISGGGNDHMYGMGGNDLFNLSTASLVSNYYIDGGEGADTIVYYAYADHRIVADMGAGIVVENGRGGQDTIVSIENIYGSLAGGDYIVGSDADNVIGLDLGAIGGTALGMGGNDHLIGGRGDDVLIGGAGNDILEGGAGNDTYVFAAGDGIDIIRDTQGENILQIDGGITLSDLVVTRKGNDLVIHIASGVTFENYFTSEQQDNLFLITFSDGSYVDVKNLEINNQAPVAQADQFILDQDASVTGNVFADNGSGVDLDPDGNAIFAVASVLTTDFGGSFVLLEDGSFTYTPALGFVGLDIVTYSITDGFEGNASAEVTFAVTSTFVNSAPVAVDDLYLGDGIHSIHGNVLDNDSDIDGDVLSVTPVGEFRTDAGGIVSLGEDGSFTYSSVLGYLGEDHFSYSVSDGQGGEDSALVYLSMEASANSIFDSNGCNILVSGRGDSTMYGLGGNDLMFGRDGNDQMFGGIGHDVLYGGNGNDLLVGSLGKDTLFGGNGNDILVGGDVVMITREDGSREFRSAGTDTGNDILMGGNGNDLLIGGGGRDLLYGDGGADTFMFLEADGQADQIFVFNTRQGDKIDLSNLLEGYDPLSDAIADFVQVTTSRGQTTISVDVDGGADNFVNVVTVSGNIQGDLDNLISKGALVV